MRLSTGVIVPICLQVPPTQVKKKSVTGRSAQALRSQTSESLRTKIWVDRHFLIGQPLLICVCV